MLPFPRMLLFLVRWMWPVDLPTCWRRPPWIFADAREPALVVSVSVESLELLWSIKRNACIVKVFVSWNKPIVRITLIVK